MVAALLTLSPASSATLLAHRDGLPEFGAWTVVTQARPQALPLLLVLVPAGLYLLGARRLRARGDRWPVGRSLSFLVGGLGTIAVATMSGLAAYDASLFSAHMVQHMLLAMVAPVFLALGAPITLALRTLPLRPRRVLLAVLHSRVAALLSHPLVPWLLFVASPFALYFTGWYEATLDDRLLHELLHVHFLLVGSLFFWPLLGIDPVPGRSGHPFRMLLVAATLPFHAFLGVAIMSVEPDGRGLLAADHYLPLHGLAQSVYQQQLGGGLLWASGDLVGLLFLAVLLVQWMRASEREAAREDRRLDRLEAAEPGHSRPAGVAAPHSTV
ncbi:MAG: Cytochrome c oxidase caa3-type assembly factor CtaG_BS (unrelated to Cox11-CtaG family) [uncultured Frankineae bacterium]|uniref:Cytochrome c oxidase caa3-type assembly factor CtaG_BS (Unrelated to Cox11-CtaG family) n=1 Tax=uncultured Frankineae bacterium TaxID=437475 RepID=A0A6J4KK92_9ACTN|nr:MAG: Cytochrome c oxidase caa3-type assembly factor CtaG_BS (unrelated to Cox11-CtaG family) [uncultured Frankineae bacterium]